MEALTRVEKAALRNSTIDSQRNTAMKLSRTNSTAIAVAVAAASLITASPSAAAPSARCAEEMNRANAAYAVYGMTGLSVFFDLGLRASQRRRMECSR